MPKAMPISNREIASRDSIIGRNQFAWPALTFVFVAVAILGATNSVWCQSKSPSATLVAARHKYVGAQVKIKGPLESSSPGLLATYINWRVAKRGPGGRYHAVSPIMEARLPYGYERHGGSILAVQISDNQVDAHDAGAPGPSLDFVVKFDDQVVAVCTCPLTAVDGNFIVVHSRVVPQK